ncbi:MAG: molybdopterin-binding protein [Halanaeroarchaeum sp.]
MALSARTRLTGTVTRIEHGDVVAEITLELESGATVAGTITETSVRELELETGDTATAVVKATDVMFET